MKINVTVNGLDLTVEFIHDGEVLIVESAWLSDGTPLPEKDLDEMNFDIALEIEQNI